MVGWWQFLVRFLFHPVEIFPKFTKMSGSLRQNMFGKLYYRFLNNLIQKQIFIIWCDHTSGWQMYFKRCSYMLKMEGGAI